MGAYFEFDVFWVSPDRLGGGLESDADEVENAPNEDVGLDSVPNVHKSKGDDGGAEAEKEAIFYLHRLHHGQIKIPGKY